MYRDNLNHFIAIAALGYNDIELPWWLSSKESACSAGGAVVMGSIPGLGRYPGEGIPTPVFWLGEFHGQRSLVGSSPWGRKESDMTEHTQT